MRTGTRKASLPTAGVALQPDLGALRERFVEFCCRVAAELIDPVLNGDVVARLRKQIKTDDLSSTEELQLSFVSSVVLDLVAQGWRLRISDSTIEIYPPFATDSPHSAKDMVRSGHLLGRDAQLRQPPIAEFLRGMEVRRLTACGWHSIFSLMRDGRELSQKLEVARDITDEEERAVALSTTISPYIQFVETGALCANTGLPLSDVWRYFRYTWVNEYKSVPGRSIMILIRDAAAANHPVIGIAALGSSVVQHSIRDKWIGWDAQTFVQTLLDHQTSKIGHWLLKSLSDLIAGVYMDDLYSDHLCTPQDLATPTNAVIEKLTTEAGQAMRRHRLNPQKNLHKRQGGDVNSDAHWESEALTHLYRSKRCRHLSKLLLVRRSFQDHGLESGHPRELRRALTSAKVQSAVAALVRMIKAEHVGIDMMDVTVCGALAPYNALLGGKLVCMLMCSPEVTHYYSARYNRQVSIIASSMKGRAVIRKPNLVLLCTTSLYGVGSSQYNRVKIPLENVGGRTGGEVNYKELGHSIGFGTYHFSKDTVMLGSTIISRRKESRRVNSIFGEGVNPLMRKIREALDLVGLKSDDLLQHGNQRVTYGIKLADNFREILLGINHRPSFLIPQTNPHHRSKLIAEYWCRRWLSPRINRPGILELVAKHTLSYPITHGAAVSLPTDTPEFPSLFSS